MVQFLHTQSDLSAALGRLIAADPRLMPVLDTAGHPPLRRRAPGFPGLAQVICGQQLSTASAGAIWARLEQAFVPFDPDPLRKARADRLARLGLSAAKIKSIKAIASAIGNGQLDLDAIAVQEADSAHQALIAFHGIGPWTADIYLLFCLGHADAFPAGDLALQEALRIGFGMKARPTAKELIAIAECWRPYRGVAAHLLWHYYHVVKRRDGAPMQAKPPRSSTKAGAATAAGLKVPAKASATVRSRAATAVQKKAVSNGRKRPAETLRPKP